MKMRKFAARARAKLFSLFLTVCMASGLLPVNLIPVYADAGEGLEYHVGGEEIKIGENHSFENELTKWEWNGQDKILRFLQYNNEINAPIVTSEQGSSGSGLEGMILPDGTTIDLPKGAVVKVTSMFGDAIYAKGNLTIKGYGLMRLYGSNDMTLRDEKEGNTADTKIDGDDGKTGSALVCNGKLTFDGGSPKIIAVSEAYDSHEIEVHSDAADAVLLNCGELEIGGADSGMCYLYVKKGVNKGTVKLNNSAVLAYPALEGEHTTEAKENVNIDAKKTLGHWAYGTDADFVDVIYKTTGGNGDEHGRKIKKAEDADIVLSPMAGANDGEYFAGWKKEDEDAILDSSFNVEAQPTTLAPVFKPLIELKESEVSFDGSKLKLPEWNAQTYGIDNDSSDKKFRYKLGPDGSEQTAEPGASIEIGSANSVTVTAVWEAKDSIVRVISKPLTIVIKSQEKPDNAFVVEGPTEGKLKIGPIKQGTQEFSLDKGLSWQDEEPDTGEGYTIEKSGDDYYVVVENGSKSVDVRTKAEGAARASEPVTAYDGKTKNEKPNPTVQYKDGTITGLDAKKNYEVKVGGKAAGPLTFDGDNLKIGDEWYGQDIEIVEKGDQERTSDSDPWKGTLAARPAAPSTEGVTAQKKDGQNTFRVGPFKQGTQEFSVDAGKKWLDENSNGDNFTIEKSGDDYYVDVKPGTSVDVRTKATEDAPYSESVNAWNGKTKNETPDVSVDYESGKLKGLDPNKKYEIKVGGNVVSGVVFDSNGEIQIPDDWYGKNIEIVEKGDGANIADSDAWSETLRGRQDAPDAGDFTVAGPSGGNENLTVTGPDDADYEYRYSTDGGDQWENWKDLPKDGAEVPNGSIVEVRKKTSDDAEASDPTKVWDGKTKNETPDVSVDYESGKLKGLDPNKDYEVKVGGNAVSGVVVDANGEILIPDDWYGKDIEIVEKGDEEKNTAPSDAWNTALKNKQNSSETTPPGPNVTKTPEATPNVAVDYASGRLTGLTPNASYDITVDGQKTTITAGSDGTAAMADEYYGKTIEIVKKGNNTTTEDSTAQKLAIHAKTTMPEDSGFTVTPDGDKVVIGGITADMEWSKDGGKTWIPGTGEDIVVEVGDNVMIRRKATAGTAPSDAVEIKTADKLSVTSFEQLLTQTNTDKNDVAGSSFGKLRLVATGQNTAIKLKWKKVTGADGYIIYGAKCGKKIESVKELKKNQKSLSVKKIGKQKLKAATYYKFLVVAYKNVNGNKVVVTTSKTVHCSTTKKAKFGNPKKVNVKKAKITLHKGKKQKAKASYVLTKKKIRAHIAKFRYESSDNKIAAVNKKGVITAKGKGKATIYVYAQNGVYKMIKVTVK